ncbi:hypothetical protein B1J93_11590 [Leptospira kirschneri serovar Pomona]|uniref:Uncharacterized protein n=1 Tax=Leptospira kirschneri serovar Pomona TaxID=561005 RepID=A0A1T1DM54_9LEPT|nr:hypothetical protein B1J93_11590 [Leptospira kirschneri serovar Pomona]
MNRDHECESDCSGVNKLKPTAKDRFTFFSSNLLTGAESAFVSLGNDTICERFAKITPRNSS